MDTEEVKYSMTLSDMVSGKMEHADQVAKKYEGTLGSIQKGLHNLGERAIRVAETLGISFGIIKMEEFFHEGTEMMHAFDIAQGQLENTLRNVGERAGLTSAQLIRMAEDSAKVMPFTKTQFVEMETALSRFGNMSPATFQKVLTASADMSIALKRDGKDVAYSLGRIMEAPAENGRLLRQFGITLDAQQRKYLMTLEHTGHIAQAQTFIFQELAQKGFGGAAKAAAESDPLFRYNKLMERMKFAVGEAGIALLEHLAPGLEWVAEKISAGIEYVTKFYHVLHDNIGPILTEIENDAIALGAGIAFAGIAFAVANPIIIAYGFSLAADAVISGALAIATGALTAAQWLLNIALTANPIGIVVVAIGAAITGTILLYQHSEKFRAVLQGIGEVAKDVFVILKALYFDLPMALLSSHPFDAMKAAISTAVAGAKDIASGSAFNRGYDESLAESAAKDKDEKHKSTLAKLAAKHDARAKLLAPIKSNQGVTSKVTGTKQVNIHIAISSLIKDFKVETISMKEGAQDIKEMVTKVLLSAVNDSQIVAGI